MRYHIHSVYFPKGTGFQRERCHGVFRSKKEAEDELDKLLALPHDNSNQSYEPYQYEPFIISSCDVIAEGRADCLCQKISAIDYARGAYIRIMHKV